MLYNILLLSSFPSSLLFPFVSLSLPSSSPSSFLFSSSKDVLKHGMEKTRKIKETEWEFLTEKKKSDPDYFSEKMEEQS